MSSSIPARTSHSLAASVPADGSIWLAGSLLRQGVDIVPPAQQADDCWTTSRRDELETTAANRVGAGVTFGQVGRMTGTSHQIHAREGTPIED